MIMNELYLKEESYKIIGICMEVHKILGKGHSEKFMEMRWNMNFKRIKFLIVGN
ncbi:hypothetical protein [Flavobacterium sp. 90]|uniref:hypothetical protein n=1 Tax=unclassified Flavobacterium TaxID=196869 RepID=UPI0026D73018